jgi:hypothetical protein
MVEAETESELISVLRANTIRIKELKDMNDELTWKYVHRKAFVVDIRSRRIHITHVLLSHAHIESGVLRHKTPMVVISWEYSFYNILGFLI